MLITPSLVLGKSIFAQQNQQTVCWLPGDTRNEGINNRGIDQVLS